MTMDIRKEIDEYLKGTKQPEGDLLKFLVQKLVVFQEQLKQLAPQIEKFRQTLESAAKQQAIIVELCNQYYNDIQNELIRMNATEHTEKEANGSTTLKAVEDDEVAPETE